MNPLRALLRWLHLGCPTCRDLRHLPKPESLGAPRFEPKSLRAAFLIVKDFYSPVFSKVTETEGETPPGSKGY